MLERRGGTNIIKRTEEFLKNRDNNLKTLKNKLLSKKFNECSFKPHLNVSDQSKSPSISRSRSQSNSSQKYR